MKKNQSLEIINVPHDNLFVSQESGQKAKKSAERGND